MRDTQAQTSGAGRATTLTGAVLGCVLLGATLAGCRSGGWGGGGAGAGRAADIDVTGTTGQIEGLMPQELVIHPLTRIGSDLGGSPALICHIELKDRFGQSVKTLGALRVELYGHAAAGEARVMPANSALPDGSDADAATGATGGAGQAGPEAARVPGRGWATGMPPLGPPDASATGAEGNAPPPRRELVWEVDLRAPEENARFFDDLVTRTYTVALGGLPGWVVEWSRDPRGQTSGPTLAATFTFGDGKGGVRTLRAATRILK